jgi:hypothetical protein
MGAERPKMVDFAEYFGISLTSFANWRRQGCPDSSIPAAVAWRTRRDLQGMGADPATVQRLEKIQAEHSRRWIELEERIGRLNGIRTDVDGRGHFGPRSVSKASGLVVAALQRELLDLPGEILRRCGDPRDLPVVLYESVFAALDRVRGEDGEDKDTPAPGRRKGGV